MKKEKEKEFQKRKRGEEGGRGGGEGIPLLLLTFDSSRTSTGSAFVILNLGVLSESVYSLYLFF